MFLSLRTQGVKTYLHINLNASPAKAKRPVPKEHLEALKRFAVWLFGTDDKPPFVPDSREIEKFGKILENAAAREYIERNPNPNFEVALRLAGGDVDEIRKRLLNAAEDIELALGPIHSYLKSNSIREAVKRAGGAAMYLLTLFPDIRAEIQKELPNG
jgi:hypothetical protein